MRNFLTDTKDVYERIYGKEICINFPMYGEFWSRYIGQRKENPLKHYNIDSSKTGIKNFEEKYGEMTFAHYGIFIDLANCRIELDALSKNEYKTIGDMLAYWNSFSNVVSKMGDSILKYKSFLDRIEKLLGMKRCVGSIKKTLMKKLKTIIEKRDFLIHFATLPYFHDASGKIKKIPKEVHSGDKLLLYSDLLSQDISSWVDVELQIRHDLDQIEKEFNESHKIAIRLLEKYKKFSIVDPGPADGTSELGSNTNIKANAIFLSSSGAVSDQSGISGYKGK